MLNMRKFLDLIFKKKKQNGGTQLTQAHAMYDPSYAPPPPIELMDVRVRLYPILFTKDEWYDLETQNINQYPFLEPIKVILKAPKFLSTKPNAEEWLVARFVFMVMHSRSFGVDWENYVASYNTKWSHIPDSKFYAFSGTKYPQMRKTSLENGFRDAKKLGRQRRLELKPSSS